MGLSLEPQIPITREEMMWKVMNSTGSPVPILTCPQELHPLTQCHSLWVCRRGQIWYRASEKRPGTFATTFPHGFFFRKWLSSCFFLYKLTFVPWASRWHLPFFLKFLFTKCWFYHSHVPWELPSWYTFTASQSLEAVLSHHLLRMCTCRGDSVVPSDLRFQNLSGWSLGTCI